MKETPEACEGLGSAQQADASCQRTRMLTELDELWAHKHGSKCCKQMQINVRDTAGICSAFVFQDSTRNHLNQEEAPVTNIPQV